MARVVLIGNGKMGKTIEGLIAFRDDMEVVGEVGIENADILPDGLPEAELAIDFSNPALLPGLVAYAQRVKCAVVSGTTGLTAKQLADLADLGKMVPVIHSGNYSLGVAVLRKLTAEAGKYLAGWDEEVVETHHNQKVDAPSGTAKMLVAALDPEGTRPVVYGREGIVGARTKDEIGVHSLRGGTVAGTHEVHFFGPDEEVVLTHRASSRTIFAEGALAAATRLLQREPGFYTFDELMFGAE